LSPTFRIKGARRGWKFQKEILLLACLHWYFPNEIKFQINLFLEEVWPREEYLAKELMLSSKKTMIGYMIIQDKFSENDFFGNILKKENLEKFHSLKFTVSTALSIQKSDKQYTGWCRGPKDKGTTLKKGKPEKSKSPNRFIAMTQEISYQLEQEVEYELKLQTYLDRIESMLISF
jgi:hypothetical protein